MQILNEEIQEMWKSINTIGSMRVGNPDFKWAIALNKGIVKPLINAITEAASPDEGVSAKVSEFNKKRVEKIQGFADRNERGDFILRDVINPFTKQPDREYRVDPSKQAELDTEITILREEYKEALDAQEQAQKDFAKLLKKSVNVDFHTIKREDVPIDELTSDQLYGLLPLIQNNGEEPKG